MKVKLLLSILDGVVLVDEKKGNKCYAIILLNFRYFIKI